MNDREIKSEGRNRYVAVVLPKNGVDRVIVNAGTILGARSRVFNAGYIVANIWKEKQDARA